MWLRLVKPERTPTDGVFFFVGTKPHYNHLQKISKIPLLTNYK